MEPSISEQEKLISTREAALLFGYTNDYVSKLAREGKVTAQRVGKTWFVNEGSLKRFAIETRAKEEQRLLKLREERTVEYKSNGHKISTSSAPRVIVSPVKKTSTFKVQIAVVVLGLFVFTATFITGFGVHKLSNNFSPNGMAHGAEFSPTVSKEISGTESNFSFSAPVTPSLVRAVQKRAHDTVRAVSVPVPENIESVYDVRTPKTMLTLRDLHTAFLDAPVLIYFSSVELVNRYIEGIVTLSRSVNKISVLADQHITSVIAFQDRFVDHVTDLWIDRALIRDELVLDISSAPSKFFRHTSAFLLNIKNDYEPKVVVASAYIAKELDFTFSRIGHSLSNNAVSAIDTFSQAPSLLASAIGAFTFSPYVTKTSTVEYGDSFTWFEQIQYGFRSLFGQNPPPEEQMPDQEVNRPTATTTIVERIVDRTPTTVVNNITEAITVSGISSDELATRLQELENALRSEIYLYSARAERGVSGNYRAIQLSQVINNLDGVTISNPIISGGSISGTSGLGATSLNGLSDVALSGAAYGNVLLHNGTEWVNVATSSLGIVGGGGSSFGQAFELTSGALVPTTTVGVIVSASSTITALSSTYGTTTNATSTNLFASNFTLGSLTGILRATAGVVATATIDLVNDVGSSILAVANGGTGWANLQANTLLLGNGTSRVATTSAGTNGQVLSLVSGVPSWVATTTFSGGLTYSGGNVTADCVTITGSASLCDGDDATGGGASFGQVWETGPFGYIAPTTTSVSVIVGATTTAQNAYLGIYATSTAGDLVFASSTASFAGNFFKAVTSAGTTLFQIAANGVASFASNLVPTANDGASLGISGTAFSDLFLASGGIINFLAGDVTLTHSGDTLTFGGAASGYIFNDGYVGVASTSPWARLAVNPIAGDVNQFVVGSSTATSFIINSAGNVGIGTSSPAARLHIDVGSNGVGTRIAGSNTNGILHQLCYDNATCTYVGQASNGNLFLGTDFTNKDDFVVTTSGNVGIGTTTPSNLGQTNATNWLHLEPTTGFSSFGLSTAATAADSVLGTLVFGSSGTAASDKRGALIFSGLEGSAASNVTANLRFFTSNAGTLTEALHLDGTGNVGIGTSTPLGQLSIENSVASTSAITFSGPNFYDGTGTGVPGIGVLNYFNAVNNKQILFADAANIASTTAVGLRMVLINGFGSGNYALIDTRTPTGLNSGNLILQGFGGNVGIGTTSPSKHLSVTGTVSDAQLSLAYDATRYANFQVTSAGDLVIDAQGGDVSLLGENLFVCTGGACPSGPAGTGNLLVEGIFILPNGTGPTVTTQGALALDTTNNDKLLVADDGGTARVIQTKQKIWSVTVASTSPAFVSAGLLPIPVELDGYTMTDIRCKVDTGTSKVVAVEDASANSTEDITCATTVTSDDGSLTNATATAAEEMYIDFGATSGAVDYVTITVYGYWTRE